MGQDDDCHGSGWGWNRRCSRRDDAKRDGVLEDKVIPDLRQQGLYPPSRPSKDMPSTLDDGNVFVIFKRFVDSTFRSIDDGIRHLPSNIAELKDRMREERTRQMEQDLKVEGQWMGMNSDSPLDFVGDQVNARRDPEAQGQALPMALTLLRRARDLNKDVPVQKILDLYKDDHWWSGLGDLDRFASPMLSLGGACYYMPETGDNLPSTLSWKWSTPSHRWLSIEWFKRSCYSPVTLENDEELGRVFRGGAWREAFEDLLNVSLGKPMLTDSAKRHMIFGQRTREHQPTSVYRSSGLDWMLSLQCRGILPPQLPGMWQHRFGPPIRQSLADLDKEDGGILASWPRGEFRQLVDEIATPAVPAASVQSYPTWSTREINPSHSQEVEDMSGAFAESGEIPGDEQELYEKYPFRDIAPNDGERAAVDEQDAEDVRAYWGMPGFGMPAVLKEIEDMERRYHEIQEELAQEPSAQAESADAASSNLVQQDSKPQVLSSLTTTHTTRLPDGTVTTTVVLKQRFADGREETHESVQTVNEVQEKKAQEQEKQRLQEAANTAGQARGNGTDSGWFWR